MRQVRSAQQKKKLLEAYYKSGLLMNKFCQRENLPLSTFHEWLKKEGLQKNKLNFVSVSVADPVQKKHQTYQQKPNFEKMILKIESGISLEIPGSVSVSWLSSLLKELS